MEVNLRAVVLDILEEIESNNQQCTFKVPVS